MSASAMTLETVPFPNYTQLRKFLPQGIWHALRALSVVSAIAIAALLWRNQSLGLPVFWGLAVPILPLIFFVAPGVWRNICPLAASNQVPRLLGISRGATNSTLSEGLAFPVGMILFFALVTGRKLLFNTSGQATAMLIVGAMLAAFVGGLLFKGKSGWCSSICPLLPIQRLYGQTPFVKVANTHCQPCVGCAKNCYDFNPGTAYLADQYDSRRSYRNFRRFFAGIFPGFVLAFYLVPNPPAIAIGAMLAQFLLYMAISLALFSALDMLMQRMVNVAPIVFAVAAINIFYWFSATIIANTLGSLGVPIAEAAIWSLRGVILVGSLVWLARSTRSEHLFLAHQEQQANAGHLQLTPIVLETLKEFTVRLHPARKRLAAKIDRIASVDGAAANQAPAEQSLSKAGEKPTTAELCIESEEKRAALRPGQSLLDAIESCDGKIEAGCRMGVCGADAIAVIDGMTHLSPIGDDERATLRRLGCADNTRMACAARLRTPGRVKVESEPHRHTQPAAVIPAIPSDTQLAGDPEIRSVVIVGNGIAGITAAEHARRLHPACDIHVVSRENHALYNRMGISRLISGRSGMQGLHLLPESWYQEQRITHWLTTHVMKIDTGEREVCLATDERIRYDRLILANGSSPMVPPIDGFGTPGSFVLREADEAMGLRDYIQRNNCRRAVVAGAGLLGLEAAHALRKLGLKVSVLSNTDYILNRQLDAHGAALLQRYLASQQIEILTGTEATALVAAGNGRVSAIQLNDGSEMPAEVFLACTGVKPNVELAKASGIATRWGIVVDDRMQTNLTGVFAAGDVTEHEGISYGLWAVAVEQGQVAAINALGGQRQYQGYVPKTMLKVTGIDLLSVGSVSACRENEIEIAEEQSGEFRYRKLVLASGRAVGAILIGHPDLAETVADLVKRGANLTALLPALRRGVWDVLMQAEMAA